MKKITKEEIQRIIREETIKVLKEGMPVGSAQAAVDGPIRIFQDGTFNLDITVSQWKGGPQTPEMAVTGQLDEDSVDLLHEMGILKSVAPAPDDPMASVGGPDPVSRERGGRSELERALDDDNLEEGFMDKVKGAVGLGPSKEVKKVVSQMNAYAKKFKELGASGDARGFAAISKEWKAADAAFSDLDRKTRVAAIKAYKAADDLYIDTYDHFKAAKTQNRQRSAADKQKASDRRQHAANREAAAEFGSAQQRNADTERKRRNKERNQRSSGPDDRLASQHRWGS